MITRFNYGSIRVLSEPLQRAEGHPKTDGSFQHVSVVGLHNTTRDDRVESPLQTPTADPPNYCNVQTNGWVKNDWTVNEQARPIERLLP